MTDVALHEHGATVTGQRSPRPGHPARKLRQWSVEAARLFAAEGGLLFGGGFEQLGIQAVGVVAATLFVFPLSLAMFMIIKRVFGLRVDENIERAGIDGFYHGISSYPEFTPGAYSLPTMTKSGSETLSNSGVSPAPGD